MAGNHTPAERGIRHLWLDAVMIVPTNHAAGIDAYTVAVAAALYGYMNAAGLAWPSLRTLADRAKVKQDTVDDRLQRLERAGLLRVGRQHRRTNRYQGQIPAWILEQLEAAKSSRRRDSIPPLTETAPSGGADETAPWETETAPWQQRTAPPEHPNCPTPAANCPTGWGPTGEPTKSGEPVNGARSGGAPNGAPALGGRARPLITIDTINATIERVQLMLDRVYDYDETSGIWDLFEDDDNGVPDRLQVGSAFNERITSIGFWTVNADNEREPTTNLTSQQVEELHAVCDTATIWLDNPDSPIATPWLRRALERQNRYLNPAAGIERMPTEVTVS